MRIALEMLRRIKSVICGFPVFGLLLSRERGKGKEKEKRLGKEKTLRKEEDVGNGFCRGLLEALC